MQYQDTGLELSASDLSPNEAQRQLYKKMMNSVIGKFSQKECYPNTRYVSKSKDIDSLLEAGEEDIVDFHTISEDVCELQTIPTMSSNSPTKKFEKQKVKSYYYCLCYWSVPDRYA